MQVFGVSLLLHANIFHRLILDFSVLEVGPEHKIKIPKLSLK